MADYGVEQLVWVDESSKDERTCVRSYGWGRRGEDAVMEAPFIRGERYELRITCGVTNKNTLTEINVTRIQHLACSDDGWIRCS